MGLISTGMERRMLENIQIKSKKGYMDGTGKEVAEGKTSPPILRPSHAVSTRLKSLFSRD